MSISYHTPSRTRELSFGQVCCNRRASVGDVAVSAVLLRKKDAVSDADCLSEATAGISNSNGKNSSGDSDRVALGEGPMRVKEACACCMVVCFFLWWCAVVLGVLRCVVRSLIQVTQIDLKKTHSNRVYARLCVCVGGFEYVPKRAKGERNQTRKDASASHIGTKATPKESPNQDLTDCVNARSTDAKAKTPRHLVCPIRLNERTLNDNNSCHHSEAGREAINTFEGTESGTKSVRTGQNVKRE